VGLNDYNTAFDHALDDYLEAVDTLIRYGCIEKGYRKAIEEGIRVTAEESRYTCPEGWLARGPLETLIEFGRFRFSDDDGIKVWAITLVEWYKVSGIVEAYFVGRGIVGGR